MGNETANVRARDAQGHSWPGRILAAVGVGLAALVAICCVAPFLVAGLLAAVGLGFILKDSILIGLLVLSLAVAALGYHLIQRAKRA